MHFNIYLDKETAKSLNQEAEQSHLSRNAIIREAIKSWLNDKEAKWPEEVINFSGDDTMPPFESYRDESSHIREDPFA